MGYRNKMQKSLRSKKKRKPNNYSSDSDEYDDYSCQRVSLNFIIR